MRRLRPPGWPIVPERDRRRLRVLALLLVAAQVAFVGAWVIAGALEPGYSYLDSHISELGSLAAEHPWIVNSGIVALGLGWVAAAGVVAITLRGRPWRWVAPALFVVTAIGLASAGFLRLDCFNSVDLACRAREASWHHDAHGYGAFFASLCLGLSALALARAEWPSLLATLTLAGGIAGLALLLSTGGAEGEPGDPVGLYQRLQLTIVHGYALAIAAAALVESYPDRFLESSGET